MASAGWYGCRNVEGYQLEYGMKMNIYQFT